MQCLLVNMVYLSWLWHILLILFKPDNQHMNSIICVMAFFQQQFCAGFYILFQSLEHLLMWLNFSSEIRGKISRQSYWGCYMMWRVQEIMLTYSKYHARCCLEVCSHPSVLCHLTNKDLASCSCCSWKLIKAGSE